MYEVTVFDEWDLVESVDEDAPYVLRVGDTSTAEKFAGEFIGASFVRESAYGLFDSALVAAGGSVVYELGCPFGVDHE